MGKVWITAAAGLTWAAGSASALGQTALYSRGSSDPAVVPLDTGVKTRSGTKAPRSMAWSELQADSAVSANALLGVSVHDGASAGGGAGAFRVADVVVVPPSESWHVTGLRVFAYQPGSAASAAAPVDAMNVRIWSGPPGEEGSVLIAGDVGANVLGEVVATNLLRTPATGPKKARPKGDKTRQIWSVDSGALDIVLPAGTYWVDWQLSSTDAGKALFTPLVTVPRARGPVLEDGGALQLAPAPGGAAWSEIEDPGIGLASANVAQIVPFQVLGTLLPATLADVARVGGDAGRDGVVDMADAAAFMRSFVDGSAGADVCGPGGEGTPPDGVVDAHDLAAFMNAYARGYE